MQRAPVPCTERGISRGEKKRTERGDIGSKPRKEAIDHVARAPRLRGHIGRHAAAWDQANYKPTTTHHSVAQHHCCCFEGLILHPHTHTRTHTRYKHTHTHTHTQNTHIHAQSPSHIHAQSLGSNMSDFSGSAIEVFCGFIRLSQLTRSRMT
jgi:hypothetical protein